VAKLEANAFQTICREAAPYTSQSLPALKKPQKSNKTSLQQNLFGLKRMVGSAVDLVLCGSARPKRDPNSLSREAPPGGFVGNSASVFVRINLKNCCQFLLPPSKKSPFFRRNSLIINGGGERGIRTLGTVLPVRRFSKALLSTTQPSLQVDTCFDQTRRRRAADYEQTLAAASRVGA
jgi:hypothetical protein